MKNYEQLLAETRIDCATRLLSRAIHDEQWGMVIVYANIISKEAVIAGEGHRRNDADSNGP